MLPAATETELVDALQRVVTSGWHLGYQPAQRKDIQPLLDLVDAGPNELFPDVAMRILQRLDSSLRQNADEALSPGDEPLLTDTQSHALRILFGTHPDYHDTSVDIRRVETATLLMPERVWKGNTFSRTWEKPTLRLVVLCLRASYGQEEPITSKRHESVRRSTSSIIGVNGRRREVVSEHVSRSMLERLDVIRTRFNCLQDHEGISAIEFESVSGVGPPEIVTPQPWEYILRFPLLAPVGLGEQVSWSFRRRYVDLVDANRPQFDWLSLVGNVRGFTVAVDVTFECDPPPSIWRFAMPTARRPGVPGQGEIVRPDANARVTFPEFSDTRPDYSYGIAWTWDPKEPISG